MKTIKLFTLLTLLVLAFSTVSAQETIYKTDFGLKVLPAFSSFTMQTSNGETVVGTNVHGYGAGISLQHNFNNYFGAEVDFIYNSFSKYYQNGTVNHRVTLNYLDVPLLLTLSTNKALPLSVHVECGPQLGFNAGSNMQNIGGVENDSVHAVFAVRQVALDFAYGGGFQFSFSKSQRVHAGIGFRGTYGVTRITNNDNSIPVGSYYILNNNAVKTYAGYVALIFSF